MANDFNRFEYAMADIDINRSVFDLDHSHKTSFNVGQVVPIFVKEVLPGDTWSIDTTKVLRVQPMVAPIMDNLYLDTYYFFVPYRIIWQHWKNFMGENKESAWHDEVTYSIPQLIIPDGGFKAGSIADYLGVPINQGSGQKISALPFRAYASVMNDWFRDENLQNPCYIYTGDSDVTGDNDSTQVNCYLGGKPFIASKYKDYFTTCLPQPQRGESPSISLGVEGTIYGYDGYFGPSWTESKMRGMFAVKPLSDAFLSKPGDPYTEASTVLGYKDASGNLNVTPSSKLIPTAKGSGDGTLAYTTSSASLGSNEVNLSNLFVDLSDADAIVNNASLNINNIRQAFAVQRYLERSARAGSRYIESIKAFFGVDSPDGRMQYTEYLGGNRCPLNVTDVTQTSATVEQLTPQGNLTGKSLTGDTNSDFTKSFTEDGLILGVAVCRYKHTYQNGIERFWSRKYRFDFYNPVFANLGEMGVLNKEIFLSDDATVNNQVFGYNEAWSDYRFANNRVSGEMRSNYELSLDCWHLADDYSELPHLGDTWIREDKNALDRCLAVTSSVSNQIIGDFYFKINVARPMPLYSIPGLIDHH